MKCKFHIENVKKDSLLPFFFTKTCSAFSCFFASINSICSLLYKLKWGLVSSLIFTKTLVQKNNEIKISIKYSIPSPIIKFRPRVDTKYVKSKENPSSIIKTMNPLTAINAHGFTLRLSPFPLISKQTVFMDKAAKSRKKVVTACMLNCL